MTTMTPEQARRVKRPTIRVERTYAFYSTTHDTLTDGPDSVPLRMFTGQRVRVLVQTFKPGHPDWSAGESERLYRVQTADDHVFEAYAGELNGWFKDTGQFYGPSGVYGSKK